MSIGDLKTPKGVKDLNSYLEDKSYISGYEPSQDDVKAFDSMGKAPGSDTPNALRWYNHIKSFNNDERKKFPAGTGFKTTSVNNVSNGKGDDDDDVDLFASDEEEDKEAEKIREERLKAYNEKKSKKAAVIAKSSIILDVKPWDDETDMKLMEKNVRTIEMDGLVWGASKLVPVGYGIHKLQIMCVVEDEKVSVDVLVEEIEKFEDYVQSVDIAAFNKI
ncbi:elongation factor 1-beta', putative [Pediculus humanus corporis]|uniref:Elongation factor 1-beta', putative n=1 Tax=Pediculus humanus subsp. corporis TaxID=121224 RepID=E0VE53_PEDHC|nr:elongation factor 1-beta', putative [Pediculus humanus corporis]EEB11659.1 elongation factor 1-beta', putative [Pediculus humanus corporis]